MAWTPFPTSLLRKDAEDAPELPAAAVGLVHRLEDLQDAPPVKDATTRRPPKDRKQRHKEQEKKKALGHKENDDGGWDWEMEMWVEKKRA